MRPSRRRFALPTTALAVALALTACGTDDPADLADAGASADGDEGAEPTDTASDDPGTTNGGDVTVPGLVAVESALDEVDGVPFSISRSDDYRTWEVDVMTGDGVVEVSLDATGETVRGSEPEDDLAPEHREAVENAPVSLVEAVDTAIAEIPGDLTDAELDDDTPGYLWTVTVDDGGSTVDVDVARTSGTIVGIGERAED